MSAVRMAVACAALHLAWTAPSVAQRLTTEAVTRDVRLPTWVGTAPDDEHRLFIAQKDGLVRIFGEGRVRAQPFLDLSSNISDRFDGGLMSVAFHPGYSGNGWVFVYFTDASGDPVVERYTVSSDPNVVDPASRREIIRIPDNDIHAGGTIAFSPGDGHLYITVGDGGPQGDPDNHAQNPQLLLGKVLRIDVDRGLPYTIPPDNPFRSYSNARDEIWAIGFRNPWRAAFDRATGDLYVADVGYETWEEVSFIADGDGGRNFGWAIKEGSHCRQPPGECDPQGVLTDPIVEYRHSSDPPRCSISGGNVYRGGAAPLLAGRYFYADLCGAAVFSIRRAEAGPPDLVDHSSEIRKPDGTPFGVIVSFGEAADGELLLVDHASGIYRIVTSMQVTAPELRAGEFADIGLSGATPGASVLLFASLRGTGATRVESLDVTLALRQPVIVGRVRADGQGRAAFSGVVPQSLRGQRVWLQAAEPGNTSDVATQVIR